MKTQPHPSRIRVALGDRLLVDTRDALVAHDTGGSAFYLLPEADLAAELRGDTDLEVIVDGRPLTTRARRHEAAPGFVQLDPVNLYDVQARWSPGELAWTEEGRPSTVHARNPHHRVDALPMDGSVTLWWDGQPFVETTDARLVLEAPLPLRVYVAESAFPAGSVTPAADAPSTWCPYKGLATYFDLKLGDEVLPRVLWGYDASPLNHLLPELHGYRGFVADDRLTYALT